jgi:heparanase
LKIAFGSSCFAEIQRGVEMESIAAQRRFCIIALVLALGGVPLQVQAQAVSLDPAKMPRIGSVDERFGSYNIEMAEVTGGNFWKPYGNKGAKAAPRKKPVQLASTSAGMDPNLYQYRPPIDLSNPRLRKLAAALGPAYVRVSGTWADSVYFANSDKPPANAPAGYNGVLTRKQWKGVIDFTHAVNAELVTSFATGTGTRNAQGVWTPKGASAWLGYTKSISEA